MRSEWPKLASLAQEICTLKFQFLVNSLWLPKDTLLRTYLIKFIFGCTIIIHITTNVRKFLLLTGGGCITSR